MEKLTFTVPQTGEEVTFFIVEETKINGYNYLLVTEEDASDEAEAYILKDMSSAEDKDAMYEFVEDDDELDSVSAIFAEILEDITLE